MNKRLWIALAAATALLVLGLACDRLLGTKIKDIQADPRKYEGRRVTVSGTVVDTVNLLVYKAFVLDDGTGQIRVVTDRILPRKGQRTTVRGTVKQGFGESVVIVEEGSAAAKQGG